jgi:hypothetical protein
LQNLSAAINATVNRTDPIESISTAKLVEDAWNDTVDNPSYSHYLKRHFHRELGPKISISMENSSHTSPAVAQNASWLTTTTSISPENYDRSVFFVATEADLRGNCVHDSANLDGCPLLFPPRLIIMPLCQDETVLASQKVVTAQPGAEGLGPNTVAKA